MGYSHCGLVNRVYFSTKKLFPSHLSQADRGVRVSPETGFRCAPMVQYHYQLISVNKVSLLPSAKLEFQLGFSLSSILSLSFPAQAGHLEHSRVTSVQ